VEGIPLFSEEDMMLSKQIVSRENFRFLGSLDSARTAHVFEGENTQDNWWLPKDQNTWIEHNASAEAIAIKQVIWGDIIALPRNIFFDSPPWFSVAEHLLKINIPTFALGIYPKELSLEPSSYVKEVANGFGNAFFALSAWPGLEQTERIQVSENIAEAGNFKTMFKGIRLDSAYRGNFIHQQGVLQKVLEYAEKNYKIPKYQGIISRAGGAPTNTWQKIWDDVQKDRTIPISKDDRGDHFSNDYLNVFREIREKALDLYKDRSHDVQILEAMKWLNQRTNLYREIWSLDDEKRDLLRNHIDIRYTETLSESTTGIGSYEFLDRSDTKLEHEIRDRQSDYLDKSNDPNGLLEDTDVIFSDTEQTVHFYGKVLDVLNDEEATKQIIDIRRLRREKEIGQSYQKEKEIEHLEFMSNRLPELMIENRKDAKIILFAYNNLVTYAIVIGSMYLTNITLTESVIAGRIIQFLIEKLEGKIEKPVMEKGRKFLLDNLYKGKRRVLTGKVRNWLNKKE
jgi:hypothetical protein